MNRWLAELKNIEYPENQRTQKPQNPINHTFEAFEANDSVQNENKNVVDIARAKLIKASNGLDVSIDGLMGWYENDYERIRTMELKKIRAYIVDYVRSKQ